ncbi:hypothetical protein AAF712_013804 [Marasmius tenuissimus]|uniref:Uncharacterized protein n=1 Tax=Marasmius tenuissimus TaxID=585030 RepID=A0ABR2ZCR1_9AGAR
MCSAIVFFLALIAVAAASVLPSVVERDVQTGRVRMMMWFRKNPNMSFKDFSDHWRLPHTDLFLNTAAVKRNMLKYEQLHVNQEWKQKLIAQGYNVPNFDGIMIAEAATMDKVLEASRKELACFIGHMLTALLQQCFSNDDYNDIVLPDSFIFSDMTSAVYGAFDIATSINKEPNPPAYKVIRTDIKRAVIDFTHKNGQSYTDFTNYFRNTHTAKINSLISSSGVGKDITKYEQLTLNSKQSTVPNPFTPMSGWDAAAQVTGPNFQYLLDNGKNTQFVTLMQQDSPNFVNLATGYQFIPVDVVSYQIPK